MVVQRGWHGAATLSDNGTRLCRCGITGRRTYSEPHWDARRGAAMAYERVTLYGLPIVPRRRVGYATVEPDEARDLFIRHALVEADWLRPPTPGSEFGQRGRIVYTVNPRVWEAAT